MKLCTLSLTNVINQSETQSRQLVRVGDENSGVNLLTVTTLCEDIGSLKKA